MENVILVTYGKSVIQYGYFNNRIYLSVNALQNCRADSNIYLLGIFLISLLKTCDIPQDFLLQIMGMQSMRNINQY